MLLLIAALAAAVRCTTLSFQSLWLDEVSTAVQAGRSWIEHLPALFDPHQGYPLYILAMRLWSTLFGTGEAALRWPSAIAGVASVPLLFLLGRRLYGWTVGLLAAAFLAISPLAVWYSQEARAYAPVVLLTLVSWLLLWEALERPTLQGWGAFATSTLLAFFTHRLIAGLALIGQLLYVLYVAYEGRWAVRQRRLLVGLLLVMLLASLAGLWFVLGQSEAGRQFSTERSWDDLSNTFTQFSLRIDPQPPGQGLGPDRRSWLLAFAAASLAGIVSLGRDLHEGHGQRRRAVFLAAFLGGPVVVFYLLYLIRPFYYERYLLGALPAYHLLLAVGAVSLWRWAIGRAGTRKDHLPFTRQGSARARPRPWQELLSVPLGLLALACTLIPLAVSWRQIQDWSLSRRPSKEQFREATRYLQEHLHPGDLVIVHPGYIQESVAHYQARWPRVPLDVEIVRAPFTEDYSFRDFEADMDDFSRGRRRAWLYVAPYHAATWDPDNLVQEWFLLNPFHQCDENFFNGIALYCITFNEDRREGFPTPTIPLEAPFGQAVLLWGADLEPFQRPLEPGDTLPATLYVRGLQGNLPDLEAVVRLVGADGSVWAEMAGRPVGGFIPTTHWIPGDDFLDYHELPLPEEIPAGQYLVQVGYRQADDAAHPLFLPDGSQWTTLGSVNVRNPIAGGTSKNGRVSWLIPAARQGGRP